LINNRQNGRRRGRGGNGQQRNNGGGNGGGNRIDNRARGNASQLLEKYKNLARDAQMQGDRVMTEYYLQFADHYFRVLSENRPRFEEQRRERFDSEDDFEDGEGFDERNEDPRGQRDDRFVRDERQPREERQSRDDREQREPYQREQRPRDDRQRDDRQREERPRREPRFERSEPIAETEQRLAARPVDPVPPAEPVQSAEPVRAERRPRRRARVEEAVNDGESDRIALESLPPSVLPPSFSADAAPAEPANDGESGEEPPKRRRGRPRKTDAVTVSA